MVEHWDVLNYEKQLKKVLQDNFTIEKKLRVFTNDLLSLLLLLLLHDKSPVFFRFLKIIICETCVRTVIVTRLRSQNVLDLKWLLLCQKAISGSFPLLTTPPPSAYTVTRSWVAVWPMFLVAAVWSGLLSHLLSWEWWEEQSWFKYHRLTFLESS